MLSIGKTVEYFRDKMRENKYLQKIKSEKENVFSWIDVHPLKFLIISYIIISVITFSIILIFSSPVALADDFIYSKMARSFFYSHDFYIGNTTFHQYPPLYPIVISPAYLFDNMFHVYYASILIGVLLYSTILFPIYLFSHDFLDNKKSVFIAIFVCCLPLFILERATLHSETLFYPLFLFMTLFIYKSVFEKGSKFKIIAGFLLGLCILTRFTSFIIFPAVFLIFILSDFYKNYDNRHPNLIWIVRGVKNSIFVCIISVITAGPWFIRNGSIFGYNIRGMLGYSSWLNILNQKSIGVLGSIGNTTTGGSSIFETLKTFLVQTVLFNGFLVLSSGIILFTLSLVVLYKSFKARNEKLFLTGSIIFIITEALVFITAVHHTIGGEVAWVFEEHRYVEPILPFLIAYGAIGLFRLKKFSLVIFISLIFSFIPLSFILKVDRFAMYFENIGKIFNGADLIASQPILLSSIALIALFAIFYILLRYRLNKKIIFLIAIMVVCSSGMVMSSKFIGQKIIISNSELSEFGEYLNSKISSEKEGVVFDKTATHSKYYGVRIVLGSWINAPIYYQYIDDIENITFPSDASYLITFEQLDFDLVARKNVSNPYISSIKYEESPMTNNDWYDEIYIYKI